MVDKEFLNDIEEQRAINNIVEIAFSGRKKSTKWGRNLAIAAAVIIIGIPAFGYTFPALAQHIPIIGGIFSRTDLHEQPWLEDVADYAVMIGEKQEANGISITLNEAYFDGRGILLTYLVESEQQLDRTIEWLDYNLDQEIRVMVDGQEIPTGLSGIDTGRMPLMYWIDDYTFFFILSIPLIQGPSPLLYEALSQAEEIEVISNFSNFGIFTGWLDEYPWMEIDTIAEGPWNFRLPVERGERTIVPVSERVSSDKYEMGVHLISVSPLRLTIEYSAQSSLDGIDAIILKEGESLINAEDLWFGLNRLSALSISQWQVVDNLGTTLSQIERRTGHYTGNGAWGSIHFETPNPEATQIIITPVIYEWSVKLVYDDAASGQAHKGDFNRRIEFEPIVVDLP